jgi:hypothetical protein
MAATARCQIVRPVLSQPSRPIKSPRLSHRKKRRWRNSRQLSPKTPKIRAFALIQSQTLAGMMRQNTHKRRFELALSGTHQGELGAAQTLVEEL